MKTAYTEKDGRPLVWLFSVTWKRRKSQPVEHVAITTGGGLQALHLGCEIAKRLRVPGSWVDHRLCGIPELKRIAPELYRKLRDAEATAKEVA